MSTGSQRAAVDTATTTGLAERNRAAAIAAASGTDYLLIEQRDMLDTLDRHLDKYPAEPRATFVGVFIGCLASALAAGLTHSDAWNAAIDAAKGMIVAQGSAATTR